MTGRGPRHARRTDRNRAAIRDVLCDVAGMVVQDVSALPGLGFDLLCKWCGGPPAFREVKSGSELAAGEMKARDHWGEYWPEVDTLEDALQVLGVIQKETMTQ